MKRKTIRKKLMLSLLVQGIAFASLTPAFAKSPLSLLPLPASVQQGTGTLSVDGGFDISVSGCRDNLITQTISRFENHVSLLSGSFGKKAPLFIHCLSHDEGFSSLKAKEDYELNVNTSDVRITASGETGVIRALATLRQMLIRSSNGVFIDEASIKDAPRFAWRGLMLDTARHFISLETIKRQIDAMELAKLNVLHLHLSDNEGFRVESLVFPKLTEIASGGYFYSQNEIRDLVNYASSRGVRIVPEFDIPGHSMALLKAYPGLAAGEIKVGDPLAKARSALNPVSEKTYSFLTELLTEMTALFPDKQFHIGGDEVSHVAWEESPEVEAFKEKRNLRTKSEVEAYFHQRVRKILADLGKTTVGWDEVADSPLPDDVIVQAWRTSNPVSTATAKGNRVIVSAGLYLNNLESAETHYNIDLLDPMAYSTMDEELLKLTKKNPVTAAQVSDGLVKKDVPALSEEQKSLVIGGEGALWGEVVNDELVDGRLWPRALALSEMFWSPTGLSDATDFYRRMVPVMEQMRAGGLEDESIRRRILRRISPDHIDVLLNLINVSAPTRHMSNHVEAMMGMRPSLNELTDAASTDGQVARQFRVDVHDYLSGDENKAGLITNQLHLWVRNHEAFLVLAKDNPYLDKAIPTSEDLSELGKAGLAAMSFLDSDTTMPAGEAAQWEPLLTKLETYEAASASYLSIRKLKQPPGALILLNTSDVRKLLSAAQVEHTTEKSGGLL